MPAPSRLSTNDPIVVEAALDADAPVERVMELLDFSAPCNALRERGYFFMQEPEGSVGRFRAVDPDRPDLVFVFDVDCFVWPGRIRFETRLESDDPQGAFRRSVSDYTLTATGPESSHIELIETTFVVPGLGRKEMRMEHAMLILSVQRHITRLCVHAALGVDAAMNVG